MFVLPDGEWIFGAGEGEDPKVGSGCEIGLGVSGTTGEGWLESLVGVDDCIEKTCWTRAILSPSSATIWLILELEGVKEGSVESPVVARSQSATISFLGIILHQLTTS